MSQLGTGEKKVTILEAETAPPLIEEVVHLEIAAGIELPQKRIAESTEPVEETQPIAEAPEDFAEQFDPFSEPTLEAPEEEEEPMDAEQLEAALAKLPTNVREKFQTLFQGSFTRVKLNPEEVL